MPTCDSHSPPPAAPAFVAPSAAASPSDAPAAPPSEAFDVIVIGAGVVGCAVTRRFALEGAKVLCVEKAADILDGASKANSAILHTGFDARPDSLERRCIVAGREEYLRIRSRLNLPLLATGALVLAWNGDESARLDATLQRARANRIAGAKLLTAKQVRAREPRLAADVRAALDIPGEAVIDPWSAPHAYLLQALGNGAKLLRDCAVTGGRFDGNWTLRTSRGRLRATCVINCAGLYGDRVDAALLGRAGFRIGPRKGQFLVYDKSAYRLLRAALYPPPGAASKGVIICRTVFGNVLVGPSSEPQNSRDDAATTAAMLRELRAIGERRLPALASHAVTAAYAGIRPATESADYRIAAHPARRYVSVGGIRSTGLSAALGIAGYVFNACADFDGSGGDHTGNNRAGRDRPPPPSWPQTSALAENQTRDWQTPGNGGIVCHCERVTRREILRALDGPLRAAGLSALKRRTRAGMGRCQGFYCAAALAELTRGHFAAPLAWPADRG
ncbi:MAG: NAD(P)/FAD-dependent oxidoreductase [Gammaproteobacteria bacterium]|nr:NAD(P)/FAD-dependent oxidoreductase [Gammaproteobacteria bacterium]